MLRSIRLKVKYLVLLDHLLLLLLILLIKAYLASMIQLRNRSCCINIRQLKILVYNKYTNCTFDAKIKNKKLVNEYDISGIIKNTDLDGKILKKLVTKSELKMEQDNILKLQIYDHWNKVSHISTNFKHLCNGCWSYRNNRIMAIYKTFYQYFLCPKLKWFN